MILREKIAKSTPKPTYTIPQLVAELLEAVTISHKFHLLAQDRSYASHKALEAFYTEIGDHADDIYEQFSGQENITPVIPDATINASEPVEYLEKLLNFVESTRLESSNYSHLQNQMDEVKSLIVGTLYKLRFLK